MKNCISLFPLGAVVALNADQVTTVQSSKTGYVSSSAVLSETKLGKQLKKELDQKYESIARELQTEEQRLVKASNDLQTKKTMLSADALESEQNKLKKEAISFQAKRTEKEEEFKTAEQKAQERLIKDILEVAASIGQQDSYDAVVDKESGKVLWTAAKNDCTSKLLTGLDKKFDQTTKVASSGSTKKSA